MDDVAENLRNERREPSRPTRGDIREWTRETLREGHDSENAPTFDGFETTLRETLDMWGGEFTDSEFRDLALDTFEEALSAVLDDEGPRLNAEAHETLDTFTDLPSLTFEDDLVPALLDGSKSATVRYDLDEDLSPGDTVRLKSNLRAYTEAAFGTATVADVIRTDLGDALDAVDDEGYRHNAESVADLWTALDGYYDDDLGLSTEVAVVLLDDVTEVR